MNTNKLPVPVWIVACLYLAVGTVGFVYHFHELARHPQDAIWIELTEFVAIVCGVFLLRRQNWARWLALAWILFHVVLSAFHSLHEFAIHLLFCAVIAWMLFGSRSTGYFQSPRIQPK